MCKDNIGVAKRIDVEHVSKEIADFIKVLDREVKGDHVDIQVEHVKKITSSLEKLIKSKP